MRTRPGLFVVRTSIIGQQPKILHCSVLEDPVTSLTRAIDENNHGDVLTGHINQNFADENMVKIKQQILRKAEKALVVSEESFEDMYAVFVIRSVCSLYNAQLSKRYKLTLSGFSGMLVTNPGNSNPPLSDRHSQLLAIINAQTKSFLKAIQIAEEKGEDITPQFAIKLSLEKNPNGSLKFPNIKCLHSLDQAFGFDQCFTYYIREDVLYFELYWRDFPDINYAGHFKRPIESPAQLKPYEDKYNQLTKLAYRQYYIFLKRIEAYPLPETVSEIVNSVANSLREPPTVELNRHDWRSYVGRIIFSDEFQHFLPKQLFNNKEVDQTYLREVLLDTFFEVDDVTLKDLSKQPQEDTFNWIFERLNQFLIKQQAEEKNDKSLPNIQKFKDFLQAICKNEEKSDTFIFIDTKDPNYTYYLRLLHETYQLSQARKGIDKFSAEDSAELQVMTHQQIKEYVDNTINNPMHKMGYNGNENDVKRLMKSVLDTELFGWINSELKHSFGIPTYDKQWKFARNFDKEIKKAISSEAMREHVRRRTSKLLFCFFANLDPRGIPRNCKQTVSINYNGYLDIYDVNGNPVSPALVRSTQEAYFKKKLTAVCKKHSINRVVVTLVGVDEQDEKMMRIKLFINELNENTKILIAASGRAINYCLPELSTVVKLEVAMQDIQELIKRGVCIDEALRANSAMQELVDKMKINLDVTSIVESPRVRTATPDRSSSSTSGLFHFSPKASADANKNIKDKNKDKEDNKPVFVPSLSMNSDVV